MIPFLLGLAESAFKLKLNRLFIEDPTFTFSGSGRMQKQGSRRREKAFRVFQGGWCVIRKSDAQILN